MPPRSTWKGFIRLSLVSVPVKAFSSSRTDGEIRLNQLHKETLNRIRYVKTDPERGEVQADEIVSGYEYAKGHYVVIEPDEIKKLRPQGDQSIHVEGFVEATAIDPIYLTGKTYYLLPDGPIGEKPYALLHRGMAESGVCALAKVVLSGRDQLVMLRPAGKLLTMAVLNHAAKVKGIGEFEDEVADDTELTKDELKLAKTLIEASTIGELDYGKFKDDYVDKLKAIIQAKVDGQEVVQVAAPEEPKIINLMEALKASVAAAQAHAEPAPTPKPAASKKRMAPSARRTTARKKKSG